MSMSTCDDATEVVTMAPGMELETAEQQADTGGLAQFAAGVRDAWVGCGEVGVGVGIGVGLRLGWAGVGPGWSGVAWRREEWSSVGCDRGLELGRVSGPGVVLVRKELALRQT